jgi:hypothetical protein
MFNKQAPIAEYDHMVTRLLGRLRPVHPGFDMSDRCDEYTRSIDAPFLHHTRPVFSTHSMWG